MQIIQPSSYLKYLTDTLGVKFFDFADDTIVEESEIILSPSPSFSWELGFHQCAQNHLLFLINGENWATINPEHKELFLKIRAAMKLNPNIQSPAVVACWDQYTLSQFISSFETPVELIIFEEDKKMLEVAHRVVGDHTLVVVPGFSLMLKKQEYKKTAWERIKVLAAKLNTAQS
jgi:hypothetical protein